MEAAGAGGWPIVGGAASCSSQLNRQPATSSKTTRIRSWPCRMRGRQWLGQMWTAMAQPLWRAVLRRLCSINTWLSARPLRECASAGPRHLREVLP